MRQSSGRHLAAGRISWHAEGVLGFARMVECGEGVAVQIAKRRITNCRWRSGGCHELLDDLQRLGSIGLASASLRTRAPQEALAQCLSRSSKIECVPKGSFSLEQLVG